MNILITDYYCASNRGDAAIFEGVYQSLREVYPDADFTVMTENPQAAEIIHDIDAVRQPLAGFEWGLSKKNLARAYLSLTSPLIKRGISPPGFSRIKKRANIQPYFDADLVVSTGGHHLTDYYYPGKVGMLWEHLFLSQMDIPVIIYAQTLGPFDRDPYKYITGKILNKIDLIITRDQRSKQIVEELGVTTPIHFTADAAFSMKQRDNMNSPIKLFDLSDELPPNDEFTVSLSVREWKHTERHQSVDDYAQSIAEVADWLVEKHEANIVFASTCTGLAGYHRDDRVMAGRVVNQMENGHKDRVQILAGEYTPQELVKVYQRMDLHIGMRMHSNILAMMAETPVVAIQYQFKTHGLMEQFDLLDYMIDVNNVDQATLQTITGDLIAEREKVAETIGERLPEIKKESKRSSNIVHEYITG